MREREVVCEDDLLLLVPPAGGLGRSSESVRRFVRGDAVLEPLSDKGFGVAPFGVATLPKASGWFAAAFLSRIDIFGVSSFELYPRSEAPHHSQARKKEAVHAYNGYQ